MKFCFMMSMFSVVYKSLLCILRRIFKKDHKWFSAVSGMLASSVIMMEENKQRFKFLFFIFQVRGWESISRGVINRGYLTENKYHSLFSFMAMSSWGIYHFLTEYDSFIKGAEKPFIMAV